MASTCQQVYEETLQRGLSDESWPEPLRTQLAQQNAALAQQECVFSGTGLARPIVPWE